MTNLEVQEYLKKYPDDASVSIIVANTKRRKVYEPKAALILTDAKIPAIVIDIENERKMHDEETAVCEECERDAENIKGQMDISDFPEVMP